MHYSGVLLLGSATPSVVSYQRAKEGIYKLIEMNTRYNAVELPEMSIVDMRQELRKETAAYSVISFIKAWRNILRAENR